MAFTFSLFSCQMTIHLTLFVRNKHAASAHLNTLLLWGPSKVLFGFTYPTCFVYWLLNFEIHLKSDTPMILDLTKYFFSKNHKMCNF